MMSAMTSTGCSSAKERRPKPFLPAATAEGALAAASHAGGCGSWKGFGHCLRSGNWSRSVSHEMLSLVHASTTNSTASRHMSRLRSSAGTPKASCSIGVERPVPHSTRPWESTSTVATFSATRAGCWKPGGMRLTPNPRRMSLVMVDRAPRTTSLLGHADRPSRKWCSTHHTVWKPRVSAKRISSMASS
jgi:hypothetical protein